MNIQQPRFFCVDSRGEVRFWDAVTGEAALSVIDTGLYFDRFMSRVYVYVSSDGGHLIRAKKEVRDAPCNAKAIGSWKEAATDGNDCYQRGVDEESGRYWKIWQRSDIQAITSFTFNFECTGRDPAVLIE